MCLCSSVCGSVLPKEDGEVSDLVPALELQVAVSHPMKVLGTKLRFSGRTANAFLTACRAVSSAPLTFSIIKCTLEGH